MHPAAETRRGSKREESENDFDQNLSENSGMSTIYGRYRSKSTKNLTKNPD